MSGFERLAGKVIGEIPAEEATRRGVLRRYLELAKSEARRTNCPVQEIIKSDFALTTIGRIRQLFTPMEPKECVFSAPGIGDLVYYPQRRIAVSPLLPEGTLVELSRLDGLFLETLMQDPTAVYTTAEFTSLLRQNLSEAPVLMESNRAAAHVSRLRKALGDGILGKNAGKYSRHRLIHTTPAGYSLVPNTIGLHK